MTTPATLTHRPVPAYGDTVSELVVDCEHGTTTLIVFQPRDPAAVTLHEAACVRLAIAKHYDEEGCAAGGSGYDGLLALRYAGATR